MTPLPLRAETFGQKRGPFSAGFSPKLPYHLQCLKLPFQHLELQLLPVLLLHPLQPSQEHLTSLELECPEQDDEEVVCQEQNDALSGLHP